MDDAETITGITITNAPINSVGNLSQLTYRQGVGGREANTGLVNIDTEPDPSSAEGTATSFDFYSQTNGSNYVTPLLFNFDSTSQTYTLTGIGASFKPEATRAKGKAAQEGIPFVARFGSADITSTSRFGFYAGDVTIAGILETVKANRNVIPFGAQSSGSPAWLYSTGQVEPGDLKIGETFSITNGANVTLTAVANQTYSAMLNE